MDTWLCVLLLEIVVKRTVLSDMCCSGRKKALISQILSVSSFRSCALTMSKVQLLFSAIDLALKHHYCCFYVPQFDHEVQLYFLEWGIILLYNLSISIYVHIVLYVYV